MSSNMAGWKMGQWNWWFSCENLNSYRIFHSHVWWPKGIWNKQAFRRALITYSQPWLSQPALWGKCSWRIIRDWWSRWRIMRRCDFPVTINYKPYHQLAPSLQKLLVYMINHPRIKPKSMWGSTKLQILWVLGLFQCSFQHLQRTLLTNWAGSCVDKMQRHILLNEKCIIMCI